MLKRNEYGFKSLVISVYQVLSYLDSVNETTVKLNGHQRDEKKLFDPKCFREAWMNACLYTRWELMVPPAVYIYSDRLEVVSTGGLPTDLTEEEFFRGISRPVNIKLQSILGQLGFVEQTGHGVPLIVGIYGRQAFEISENHIIVTIPFQKEIQSEKIAGRDSGLNEAQSRICAILKENPDITIKDMVRISGYSDGYIRKILGFLKSNNYIKRVGANKKGYWQIL